MNNLLFPPQERLLPKTLILRPSRGRYWRRIFPILTVLTTLWAGNMWRPLPESETSGLGWLLERGINGLPYAATLLIILLAHEMGHYLACRYYGIRATPPLLLPAPPPFGTFGAIIRIRSMFGNRRQLFDVGVAGPIAGFLFVVPATVLGLVLPTDGDLLSLEYHYEFGRPLLLQVATLLLNGDPIQLHPIAWAAWFGMLATAINLLPIGQLDGGHIVYALFGARVHRLVSYLSVLGLILISLLSYPLLGYLIFSIILLFLGLKHPSPLHDFGRLGTKRWLLAGASLAIFIFTFIPIPIRFVQYTGHL